MKDGEAPFRRAAIVFAVLVCIVLLWCAEAAAAPTRTILIIRAESPGLQGGAILVNSIQSGIRKLSPAPVEFFTETIDPVRFSSELYQRRLVDLLAEKYASTVRPDLVIALTDPAVQLVLRERRELFAGIPLLLGLLEKRETATLPSDVSVVFLQGDAASTLRLALATYPQARHALVVGGTAKFDREWEHAIRAELAGFDSRVPVAYDVDSPLPSLLHRVATLPADTVVLYGWMTRDGANAPTRAIDVLESLHQVSPVPIFSLSSTFIGHGTVGGFVIDFQAHGADLARQAAGLLENKTQAARMTTPAVPMVDWQEVRRFRISPASLPPNTVIANRQPSLWERGRLTILIASLVLMVETALVVALIRLARRRREAQRLLEARLRFGHVLSELSLSLTSVPPEEIDAAIDASLRRVAAGVGIQWVLRWDAGDPRDENWQSPQLRAGEYAYFESAGALPPTVQHKLRHASASAGASVAVPLTGGDVVGAIFWARGSAPAWSVSIDELRTVSAAVATVLQRKQAERGLQQSDRFKGAILASLPAHVAVLDRDANILAVNGAWLEFAHANGMASDTPIGPGVNYLSVCTDGICAGDQAVADARRLIETTCAGAHSNSQIEYRCDAPGEQRWFLMTAEPLRRAEGGAVVTHSDITARKINEIALRESEDRFRRMADALPMAIWMSGADGKCTYLNQQWLNMTGRTLAQETGEGWLQAVHPEDREACIRAYLEAFHARRQFRFEYRTRRHDGEYRWLLDTGIPRYGSDDAFHGYVGGCIDITERREAEQTLRDVNRRLLLAQEDERRRIARELHDHLNQQLALLAIDLQQLSIHPPDTPEALAVALHADWRRTTEIASDVHAISHRLHPSKLEALGLVATIRAHCRDMVRPSFDVRFSDQDVPTGIQPDVALCLFRVLEEALSNASRHSGARSVDVALQGTDAQIVLRVADDGRGIPMKQHAMGLGLVSMRERVKLAGGTLSIASRRGGGTIVEASVPMSATASEAEDTPASTAASAGAAALGLVADGRRRHAARRSHVSKVRGALKLVRDEPVDADDAGRVDARDVKRPEQT
jgi:PAS domain S-box-containing protein